MYYSYLQSFLPLNFFCSPLPLTPFWDTGHIYRAHSMYGFIFENSQKCTELGIRTSVHDDFNPCTDKCKSVHGNPYIRTFYGDYCIKMAFFLPFFRIFFCFLPIFSKFSRFAQIYNIYSMISNEFLII